MFDLLAGSIGKGVAVPLARASPGERSEMARLGFSWRNGKLWETVVELIQGKVNALGNGSSRPYPFRVVSKTFDHAFGTLERVLRISQQNLACGIECFFVLQARERIQKRAIAIVCDANVACRNHGNLGTFRDGDSPSCVSFHGAI